MKNKKKVGIIFIMFLIFYFGLLFIFGIGIYNDSMQYIDMHIHREPLYPTFLWLFRLISEEYALHLAVTAQSVIAAVAATYFVTYISETFKLSVISDFIIIVVVIAPTIMTKFISENGIILNAGILSESLGIPVYLIFMVLCHKMMGGLKKYCVFALVTAILLSLIRGQLMVTILMWMVLLLAKCIEQKTYKKIVVILAATLIAFMLRGETVKCYNYFANGHYINNTYGNMNFLTNVLFISDREDGKLLEDQTIQTLYYEIYDIMEENEWNDSTVEGEIIERVHHLEKNHDNIKFYAAEDVLREYTNKLEIRDYIEQDLIMDNIAAYMMDELLPHNFGKWLENYIILGFYGIVRSVAIVRPIFMIYTVLIVLLSIVFMIKGFVKKEGRELSWLLLIALLSLMAISWSTAMAIMCLSRYMIYSFVIVYTAGYIIIVNTCREKGVLKCLIKS